MKEVSDVYAHHHGDGVGGGSSDAHKEVRTNHKPTPLPDWRHR